MKSTRPDKDRASSFRQPPRRRRRITVLTVAAPLAAAVLWVSFFAAVGTSCVRDNSCDSVLPGGSADGDSADERNDLEKGARTKIKPGDSIGAIAARWQLTEDELKACNPMVDPQTLQPGQFLIVSAIDCEEADKAETGANPDPLAGDTTTGAGAGAGAGPDGAGAPDPSKNGTAAADPSTKTSLADEDSSNAAD